MVYSDGEILNWLIDEAIEFKPAWYNGAGVDRFDMWMQTTHGNDLRKHVSAELQSEANRKNLSSDKIKNILHSVNCHTARIIVANGVNFLLVPFALFDAVKSAFVKSNVIILPLTKSEHMQYEGTVTSGE